MKRITLIVAAFVLSALAVSAQDLGQATELYNSGATSFQTKNYASAIKSFEQALAVATAAEDDAEGQKESLIEDCKRLIAGANLGIAKDMLKEADYVNGIAQLNKAADLAEKYEQPELCDEIAELLPSATMQYGASLLNDKDFAGAAEVFSSVLADDPKNGTAALRKGMALGALGKTDEAVEAYLLAAENGEETAAKKQISNIYVKSASAALKDKAYDKALDAALKSNEYLENANAFKIAASAAQKLKNNEVAIANYEKYLEIAPNAKDANGIICTLAVLYQQAGDKAKASDYYKKILSDPQYGATAKAQLEALK